MFMLLSLLAAFNTLYQVKAGTGFSMSMDNTNKTRMRIDKCEASTSERRQEDVLEKKCEKSGEGRKAEKIILTSSSTVDQVVFASNYSTFIRFTPLLH